MDFDVTKELVDLSDYEMFDSIHQNTDDIRDMDDDELALFIQEVFYAGMNTGW